MTNDDLVEVIDSIVGSGTQLVSLYVPPSKDLGSVIHRLQSEHAEADYIKSKSTRQAVQRALTMAINELQKIETKPAHGIVVFAGVDSDGEEHVFVVDDLEHDVESFIYHCDSEFRTEELRENLDDRQTIGLVVVERRAATIGRLVGETIEKIRDLESDAMGKHSAGGFSQKRFERIEEEATQNFYDDVAAAVEDALDPEDGLLVGGTMITSDEFVDALSARHHDVVLGVRSVEYTGMAGLRELVDRSRSVIEADRDESAMAACETFFDSLRNEPEMVEYGVGPTERATELGAVDEILVGRKWRGDSRIEELVDAVEEKGGSVTWIPETFEKGVQFNGPFDGIAAMLRFPVGPSDRHA